MNSHWKRNSIIFAMTLVPTRSNGQIKITILKPLGVNLRSNLVQVNENHQVARVWCRNMKNVVLGWFWPPLTFGQPRVDQGHFGHEMTFWVFRCPNKLCHINLDVSVAPWKKVNIFEIFKVWHANRGRTKYDIYKRLAKTVAYLA